MKVNSGTILVGFFAILCGLVGVHLYRNAIKPKPVVQQPQPKAKPAPAKSVVPMVSRNLTSGQRITMDDIALVRLTAEQRTKMGLKKAFMTNPDQIIGKTVKNPLRRGDTFDTRDFYPVGTGPGISHRVKPGYRALTIAMTPANALIGFAGAGQKVDVLFHYGAGSGQNSRHTPNTPIAHLSNRSRNHQGHGNSKLVGATSTLAQDVEILALNHSTSESTNASGVQSETVMVTLAVRPREAEALRVARGHGELSLTLRSPNDKSLAIMPMPSTINDLINIQDQKVNEMEIFRGGSVSRLQFVETPGGTIKPRKIELPKLRIHVPSGLVPNTEFQSPPDPDLISTGQDRAFLEAADNGRVQSSTVSDVKIIEPKSQGWGETPPTTPQAFHPPMQKQNDLNQGGQTSSSVSEEPTPPNVSQQIEPPLIESRTASRPSMPGIRFSQRPHSDPRNNHMNSGMPSSLMSSYRRDYREVHSGSAQSYRTVGNGDSGRR